MDTQPSVRNVRFLQLTFLPLLLFPILIPARGSCAETAKPGLTSVFHIAGIPKLRREQRVDIDITNDSIQFHARKTIYKIPYDRIRQVRLYHADRRYEGRTYAAALATDGIGSLLILKKHHVDTVIFEYVNEHDGKMGIVLQMEIAQGKSLKDLLEAHHVEVSDTVDDANTPPPTAKQSERKDGNTK